MARLEVAGRRHQHAARAHHRLGDEGGHGLGPFGQDGLLQLLREAAGEVLLRLAGFGIAVVVRAVHVQEARGRGGDG